MKSEDKIVELLSEMLIRDDQVVEKLGNMVTSQEKIIVRLDSLEKSQAKTNIEFSEMRLSFMQVADRLDVTAEHERRISRLEYKLFI